MTLLFETSMLCAICSGHVEQKSILSTSAWGSSDLDMRPAKPERSTLPCWVQYCEFCKYCAPDISVASAGAEQIIESDRYLAQLKHASFPELANRFLCAAMVFQKTGNDRDAFWNMVYAAWASDDLSNHLAAQLCRRRATSRLINILEDGRDLGGQSGIEIVILIDLMRRSGRSTEAMAVSQKYLDRAHDSRVQGAIELERKLIASGDDHSHRWNEVTALLP